MMITSQKAAWNEERRKQQSSISKLLWTEERKSKHSLTLTGRKTGKNKSRGIRKSDEHNRKNSEALKGKLKTPEHRLSLSEAAKLRKVCRLIDQRVMSVTHFTRWLQSLVSDEPPI